MILMFIFFYSVGFKKSEIPTYTISNGTKTVVFQTMVHVGLKSFYDEVGEEMNHYGNIGYKVILEGLEAGGGGYVPLSKDNPEYDKDVSIYNKKLNQYNKMLANIEDIHYKDFKYTQQAVTLDQYNKYDYEVVDKSFLNKNEYKKKSEEPFNIINEERIKKIDFINVYPFNELINNEKKFIFLTNLKKFWLYKKINEGIYYIKTLENPSYGVITDYYILKRDGILAQGIIKEKNNFIYVNYGEAHFKGVFNLLKESDPNWKIINTTYKIALGSKEN